MSIIDHAPRRRSAGLVVMVVLLSAVLHSQPSAPPTAFIGTWKFNASMSNWLQLPPREQWRRYEMREDGFLVFTLTGVDGAGNPQFIQSAVKLDGKPYPVYSQNNLPDFLATGRPTPNSYTFRMKDARTLEVNRLRDGKENERQTQVVSSDGHTLTVTIDASNADGSTLHNVGVFEKQ